jgi:hypothetical protein
MNTIDLTVSTGLVFADARRHDLPDPIDIRVGRSSPDPVVIHLDGLADLAQWAQWAEATIEHGDPKQHIADRWAVIHEARGAIAELPVLLVAVEIGVMVDADSYECGKCGAILATTAGFVAVDTYDGTFEIQVARHQDGACALVGAL